MESSAAAADTSAPAETASASDELRQTKAESRSFSILLSLKALVGFVSFIFASIWHFIWQMYVNHKRKVVLVDWTELEFSPDEVQRDREAVLSAVKQNWQALEFAAAELRADREIVEEALRQDWHALRHVSSCLRADRTLMASAVEKSNGWALEFASAELYRDPQLLQDATSRLGGRLGLPLSPVAALVPVDASGRVIGLAPDTEASLIGGLNVAPTEEEPQMMNEMQGDSPEDEAANAPRSGPSNIARVQPGETSPEEPGNAVDAAQEASPKEPFHAALEEFSTSSPREASHATADEPPDTLPDGPRHHALDEPDGAALEVHCDASLSVKEPFEASQVEPATAAEAPAQASQTPQEEASAAMRDRSPRADSAQQADPSNSPKEHGENSREKLAELERADPSDPQRLDVCDGLVGEAASETRSEHPASTLQEPVAGNPSDLLAAPGSPVLEQTAGEEAAEIADT